MGIYIILLVSVIISLYLYTVTSHKIFKCFPYYCMAFVSGFRNEVGVDYISYREQFYDMVLKRGWYIHTEIGYRTFIQIINHLGGGPQMMFLIMACLTCFFYYKFISDNSKNFELSTMLFMCLGPFYFSSFNAVREAFAISIFLFALKYLEKDIKKYFLLLIIAGMFHSSAFIFLIFPIIKMLKKDYLLYFIYGLGLMYLILSGNIIEKVIGIFFPGRARLINYVSYMDKSYPAYLIICITLLIMDYKMKLGIEKIYMYMMICTCILIMGAMLFPKYSMILTRLVSWGTPALIVILPDVGKKIQENKIYNILIYGGCITYFMLLIRSEGAQLLPYNFNFSLFSQRIVF